MVVPNTIEIPSSPGSGSITIGDPVVGGTPFDVLFIDSGGFLAQDDNFQYDPARPTLTLTSKVGVVNGFNLNIIGNGGDSTGIGLRKSAEEGAVGISWEGSNAVGRWDFDLLNGSDDFIVRSGTASKWSIAQFGAGAHGDDGETGVGNWGVVFQISAAGFVYVKGQTGHHCQLHINGADDTKQVNLIYERNGTTYWGLGLEPSGDHLQLSNGTVNVLTVDRTTGNISMDSPAGQNAQLTLNKPGDANQAVLFFAKAGATQWAIFNPPGGGDLAFYDGAASRVVFKNGGAIDLNTTNHGLTIANQVDGAGALAGTLGNSPVLGNPTFWWGVNVGGGLKYIPCW